MSEGCHTCSGWFGIDQSCRHLRLTEEIYIAFHLALYLVGNPNEVDIYYRDFTHCATQFIGSSILNNARVEE